MFGRYWKTINGANRHFIHCQWIGQALFVRLESGPLSVHIPARLFGIASTAKDAEKNHLHIAPPKIASTRSQIMVPMTVADKTAMAKA